VASQIILDAPYRLPRRGAPDWTPENYSGSFEGRMSMRDALVRSQNIPAVRLAAATGEDRVVDLARRAGIRGEIPESPVLALGVTAVSPVEMAMAFSAFAGQGVRAKPRFVRRVEDREGNVLWSSSPERTRVLDPAVAYIVTDMLRDVVDRGTGASVRRQGYYGPGAGKTGTTSDNTDAWFVGYTPEAVAAVWIGFDDVRSLPYSATGGAVSAPVWGRVFARIGGGGAWADPPSGVVARAVDAGTGRVLDEGCYSFGGIRRELFLEGTEPPTTCPRHPRRRFGRLSDLFRDIFGGRRDPRLEGDTDPDLGVPRLPRRDADGARRSGRRDSPD
jgi:membrane peptidoglycan carboxypeptidase